MSHPLVGISASGSELELLVKVVRPVICITLRTYFDLLTFEMRSNNWREKFDRHVPGPFGQLERALESPLRVGALVSTACDLFKDFFKSGEMSMVPISQPSNNSPFDNVNNWMNKSQKGKKATNRLHKAILELVRNPTRAMVVEKQGRLNVTFYGVKMTSSGGLGWWPDPESVVGEMESGEEGWVRGVLRDESNGFYLLHVGQRIWGVDLFTSSLVTNQQKYSS
jgi:hypothetical protein